MPLAAQPIHAAEKSLTLMSESFDGKALIYSYIDDTGKEIDIYFKVPTSFLTQVKNSGNVIQEAKNQIATAYMVFDLKDRLSALNNEYILEYDLEPTIDSNFKVRFTNEKNAAVKYAKEAKERYSKEDGLYKPIMDELTPIELPIEIDENGNRVDVPSALPEIGPALDEDITASEVFMWIGIIVMILLVIIVPVFVFRKKGVR